MPDTRQDDIQAIGVDWSGARARSAQRRAIWVAVVRDGALVELSDGRDRDETMSHVLDLADEHPRTAIGLDFSFSLPHWYLAERGIGDAHDLWAWARRLEDGSRSGTGDEGASWPAGLPEPFWGPGIRPLPDELRERQRFRRTELASKRPGATPQSPFQLSGAGSVGSQSLRGMAQLARLAGASIWPFDPPGWPLVLEVFPRLMLRELRPDLSSLSGAELVDELIESSPDVLWGGRRDWRDALLERQDALDAAMCAWGLWAARAALVALPAEDERTYLLEGRIFSLDLAQHYLRGESVESPLEPSRPIAAERAEGAMDTLTRTLADDTGIGAREREIMLGVYRLLRESAGRPAGIVSVHAPQRPGSPPPFRVEGARRRFQGHWVADDLLLCNLPFAAAHVETIADQGAGTVLNMVEDGEYRGSQRAILDAAYAAAGIVEHRLRQPDGAAISPETIQLCVDLFHGSRRRGGVAVHCLGGRERSATIAAAIRASQTGETPLEAVDAIERITGDASPLPHQMRELEAWHRGLRSP